MAEEKGIPWWAKTIIYVAVPIGVLVIIWKVIESWFMGPVNAVKDLWEKQYNDFVKELKQYAEQDKGNLTAEHQTILEQKRSQIAQTEKTFAQVSGRWDYWIGYILLGVFTIIGAYVAPAIISKWKGILKKGDVQSEVGQGYIAMCMMADDLAARGMLSEAATLTTVIATRFNNVDAPYMQQQIAYWQSQMPTLVGWELLYASYIITAYQVTLTMVPVWISYLPPPVLEAAGLAPKQRG
ncbi:MAG: hypothetical protein QXO67_00420 [Candidatus Bathyarchaeia archaeon]